ncbi:outer membrane protein [Aestuariivirga sp.]|uniref:outer membrane protein n=1 Tax=Aestuariivirga sp. TaxID=2650926 RepID=UPI003018AC15
MKLIAASTLAIGLLAVPAMAADIAPAPTYSWDGVYVGVVGGYTWNNFNLSNIKFQDLSGEAFIPGRDLGVTSWSTSMDGGSLGGTLGWNYQTGAFVLGLEGDISYDWANGDNSKYKDTADFTSEADMTWFGTARVRAGYAVDRALIYATGGLAYGDVEGKIHDVYSTATITTNDSNGMWGWTIGGGLEYAITDNFTIKGEYLYYDLGQTDFSVSEGAPGWNKINANVDVNGSIVRAGLNYRF